MLTHPSATRPSTRSDGQTTTGNSSSSAASGTSRPLDSQAQVPNPHDAQLLRGRAPAQPPGHHIRPGRARVPAVLPQGPHHRPVHGHARRRPILGPLRRHHRPQDGLQHLPPHLLRLHRGRRRRAHLGLARLLRRRGRLRRRRQPDSRHGRLPRAPPLEQAVDGQLAVRLVGSRMHDCRPSRLGLHA